jgi:hypothetical protein
LPCARHHRSRMRLYPARNPARYAPCCVHGRGGCIRVEAESIFSHGAAIVAFEASGLRVSPLPSNGNGSNGFLGVKRALGIQRQIDLKQKTLDVSTETNTQARPLNTTVDMSTETNTHTVPVGGVPGRFRRILILHGRRKCVYTSPAAVRRPARLVAAPAPPSVPARPVRCAGHC